MTENAEHTSRASSTRPQGLCQGLDQHLTLGQALVAPCGLQPWAKAPPSLGGALVERNLGTFLIRSIKFLYGLNPNTLWARAQQRKREDRPSEFKRIETTRDRGLRLHRISTPNSHFPPRCAGPRARYVGLRYTRVGVGTPQEQESKGQLVGLLSYLGCLTCSQEMQASVNVLTLRRFAVCVSVMFTFIAGVLCDQHVGPSNGTSLAGAELRLRPPLPNGLLHV